MFLVKNYVFVKKQCFHKLLFFWFASACDMSMGVCCGCTAHMGGFGIHFLQNVLFLVKNMFLLENDVWVNNTLCFWLKIMFSVKTNVFKNDVFVPKICFHQQLLFKKKMFLEKKL